MGNSWSIVEAVQKDWNSVVHMNFITGKVACVIRVHRSNGYLAATDFSSKLSTKATVRPSTWSSKKKYKMIIEEKSKEFRIPVDKMVVTVGICTWMHYLLLEHYAAYCAPVLKETVAGCVAAAKNKYWKNGVYSDKEVKFNEEDSEDSDSSESESEEESEEVDKVGDAEVGDAEVEADDGDGDDGDAEVEADDGDGDDGDDGDAEVEADDGDVEAGDAEAGDAEVEADDAEVEVGDADGDAEVEVGDADGDAEVEVGDADGDAEDGDAEVGDADGDAEDGDAEVGDAEVEDAEVEADDAEAEVANETDENQLQIQTIPTDNRINSIFEKFNGRQIRQVQLAEFLQFDVETKKLMDIFWAPTFNKSKFYLSKEMIENFLSDNFNKSTCSDIYKKLASKCYQQGVDFEEVEEDHHLVQINSYSGDHRSKISTHGGHLKRYFIISGECFKLLCAQSQTAAGDRARRYFVKIEEAAQLSCAAGIPAAQLIAFKTGSGASQATCVYPEVAINIAQWLSPKFSVRVAQWIRNLLTAGEIKLVEQKYEKRLKYEHKQSQKNIAAALAAADEARKEAAEAKALAKLEQKKAEFKQCYITTSNCKKGYIYIVCSVNDHKNQIYKIGKTIDLKRRLSTYRSGNGADARKEYVWFAEVPDIDIAEHIVKHKCARWRVDENGKKLINLKSAIELVRLPIVALKQLMSEVVITCKQIEFETESYVNNQLINLAIEQENDAQLPNPTLFAALSI